jgi:hypothetical protein
MSDNKKLEDCLEEALESVENFITETTGQKPTQQEIANALKRYFVLNEIKAHVVMERSESAENRETL